MNISYYPTDCVNTIALNLTVIPIEHSVRNSNSLLSVISDFLVIID